MSNEEMEAALTGEDEAFVPDGWHEGVDFFSAEWMSESASEGHQSNDSAISSDNGNDSGDDIPTTDEVEAGDNPTDEETDESAGQLEEAAPKGRVLKLKINHKESEVDIDSMSDDELAAVFQKAGAFDVVKEGERREKFNAAYQEQIDAGMTDEVAKMIATNKVGKDYSVVEEPETKSAPVPVTNGSRDFAAEVRELRKQYPDFTEMPDEVADAAANGQNLIEAYGAWRSKQSAKAAAVSKKETATLKRENKILKQNAERANRAPVRGTTGGGLTDGAKSDFEKGFDSDPW